MIRVFFYFTKMRKNLVNVSPLRILEYVICELEKVWP